MSQTSTLLRNATIVCADREIELGSVTVEAGRISAIHEGSANLAGSVEIDLANLVLMPGFIDVHIHGAVGIDTLEANAKELNEISAFLATNGVTSWLPTLVPAAADVYARVAKAVNGAMVGDVGARVVGIHYEGPFVNTAQCGALHTEYFKTFSSPADLQELALPETESVRMTTLAPDISGGIELIRELTKRGWVVSIGHTRADAELLDEALSAGAKHMTHFMNAMPQLHHRNPGPIGWGLSRDDVTFDMIADGIHLNERVLQLLVKAKGANGISLISDAIAAAGRGDGDYEIWGETIEVKDRRTSNSAGSIAGSVITMLDAVRMMRSLGITNVDVAKMAALNPARLIKLDHECGSIEVGKRADLVALDAEGNVALTLVGGNVR